MRTSEQIKFAKECVWEGGIFQSLLDEYARLIDAVDTRDIIYILAVRVSLDNDKQELNDKLDRKID